MKFTAPVFLSGLASSAVIKRANPNAAPTFDHVAVFSVDGLHASDIDRWLAKGPSNISTMLKNGYRYTGAYTTFPSDSFPGTVAQYTGAFPRTTGVWYDDIWDRSLFPPNSSCKWPAGGPRGAEVVYAEPDDYNQNLLFSGGINPLNLPMALVKGVCQPLYPHERLRVNTVFEIVRGAGKVTAYADKHPAYDIVRGPSGTGLTTGYFPEVNSLIDAAGDDYTSSVGACMQWDSLHVAAFLNWLDGNVPANSEGSLDGNIPTLFGGNFQSVSVGQKTSGYTPGTFDFTPALQTAVQFVDGSLGAVINKLKAKNIYDKTLMIVCSKHGQSPIDPTLFKEVDPAVLAQEIGVPTSFITTDDIGLVFLENRADLDKAVANLNAHKVDLRIDQLIYGDQQVDLGYGDATKDPGVPDIIVQPLKGTIYTTSHSKIAEHGGGTDDDRNVACFVHNPTLQAQTFDGQVFTTQVAATILTALGLDPQKLQGVRAEQTDPLPGFGK